MANFKPLFLFLLFLTVLGLVGCSEPSEKKSTAVTRAEQTWQNGDPAEALRQLEALASQYPNDAEILRLMGNIYEAQRDFISAAFFLEQAQVQNPGEVELLYQTYRVQMAAGQGIEAARSLERMASVAPDSMTPDLWLQLGQARARENRVEAALEAYLKGIPSGGRAPEPETSTAIGQLFLSLNNASQAERWFNMGANSDDPSALQSLFGLLEIKLGAQEWTAAETVVNRVDKQFPGALEASEWAAARGELRRWRAAQDAMRAELALAELAKTDAQTRAAAQAEAEGIEPSQVPDSSGETARAEAIAETSLGLTAEDSTASQTVTPARTSGSKAQVIEDLEAAEAMADRPARESEEPETGPAKAVAVNPDIAIEPAEPDLSFLVSFDEQAQGATATYVIETAPAPAPTPAPEMRPTPPLAQLPPPSVETSPAEIAPTRAAPRSSSPANMADSQSSPTLSIDRLLTAATRMETERDFKAAIQLYWQAIGQDNSRSEVWNRLSRTYLVDGQAENAASTALEAVRLEPGNVNYTLDYLRVAQSTKSPADFVAELETAHDRFPRSPSIALSLARAYDRISDLPQSSRILYQRFIELAPDHPLRPEADSALARLR